MTDFENFGLLISIEEVSIIKCNPVPAFKFEGNERRFKIGLKIDMLPFNQVESCDAPRKTFIVIGPEIQR